MSFLSRLFGKRPETSEYDENEPDDEKHEEETVVEEYFYIHESPKVLEKEDDMPLIIEESTPDSDPSGGTGLMSFKDPETKQIKYVTPEEAVRLCKGNIPDGIGPIPGVKISSNTGAVNINPTPTPKARPPINLPRNTQVQYPKQPQPPTEPAVYYPPTEVVMVEGAYHLFVDLPGVKKESLNIVFDNSTLVITGERESSVDILRKNIKKPHGKKDPILQSKSTIPAALLQKFEFRYPFKKLIDESAMKATLDHGILQVTLPHRLKGDQINVPIM